MNYDIKLTAAQLAHAAAWVATDIDQPADVKLRRNENGSISVEQGDDSTTIGAPMDAEEDVRIVYVVRPHDMTEDVAAFVREEDAESFAATYDNVGDVESVTICGPKLAAEMIASRDDDEDEQDTPRSHTLQCWPLPRSGDSSPRPHCDCPPTHQRCEP